MLGANRRNTSFWSAPASRRASCEPWRRLRAVLIERQRICLRGDALVEDRHGELAAMNSIQRVAFGISASKAGQSISPAPSGMAEAPHEIAVEGDIGVIDMT